MSLLRKLSLALLLILLLLFGALAWIVTTSSGLQWALHSAMRWMPELTIGGIEGSLRNFTLSRVQYQMPGVSVQAGTLHLSLRPACLLRSQLCINELRGGQIAVAIDSQQLALEPPLPEASAEPLTDLSIAYPIKLAALNVTDLSVNVDGTTISLAQLQSGAEWHKRALTLQPTRLRDLRIALAPAAPAVPVVKPELPLTKQLTQLLQQPLLTELSEIRLPLDIQATEIVGEQLQLVAEPTKAPLQLDRLRLSASNQQSHIELQALEVSVPQGKASLEGTLTLGDNWPLDLRLQGDMQLEPQLKQQATLGLNGALKQQVKLDLQLSGAVNGSAQGELFTGQVGLPLSLSVYSKLLQWPLQGVSEYQLKDLVLRLSGKATDYRLSLRSTLQGREIPAASFTLDGQGDIEQFHLDKFKLLALQGQAELAGKLQWRDVLSWQAQLALSGINAAKQWPDFPLKLQGKLTSEGTLQGDRWRLALPEIQLSGTLPQGPLKAEGSISGDSDGQWEIPSLRVLLGNNQLQAQGSLKERLGLDIAINAPNLKGTLPGLAGTVRGTLKLTGQRSAPQLNAQLSASGLRWQDLQIRAVSLNANMQGRQQLQGEVDLRVAGMRQASLQVEQLLLQLKGNERQHHLTLTMQGEPVAISARLQGAFDRQQQRWHGQLGNTRFTTPVGEWSLQRTLPLEYHYQAGKLTIGAHCWLNPNAELCIPKAIEAGESGEAQLILNRLNLAMLQPLLPTRTRLSGGFTGRAAVSWQPGGSLPTAKLSLIGQGVKVQQQLQESGLPLSFDTLTLEAALTPTQAKLNWLLKIANNGQFSGQVRVADPAGQRRLAGEVNINSLSLAALKPLLSTSDSVKGMINADLRLGGTLQNPALFGSLTVNRLLLDSNMAPFSMQDSELTVNFTGRGSSLHGALRTTQGQFNLTGESDWRDIAAWNTRVAVRGEKVRITVPPMVRLDVSPDLQFEAGPNQLRLDGTIAVPWARISVQQLPESGIAVSRDQVMLNDQLQPIEDQSIALQLISNLRITLGEDVRLDAFGLKTLLNGELLVRQDQRGLGLHGKINLHEGRFRAYGQDLLIRRGNLLFSGPPQQPVLDIEAIRNPEATENNVIAGVRVAGPADNPRVNVFSVPAMSEQEAILYLLRGQGLNGSSGEGGLMATMLIEMGVAKSGMLVGQLGEAFGVSNLSLDTKGAGDKSQVVVSGYVLPGLQVRYGVGIFDSLATLTLRYRLLPRLYMEAVSGVDLALDLLYQFEF